MGSETGTVEGIDLDNVTAWLVERIDGLTAPLDFSLIAGGHSNLTYKFVDRNGAAYVLRRPPLGHILESAHDMAREHRIVSAVNQTNVPVPSTHGLCEDPDVNGLPFYIMKFVEGVVPHTPELAESLPEGERASAGRHIFEVLSDLHSVDPATIGLGELARKEGYVERQLKRWTKQYADTKTHDIPEMDESERLLHENVPEQIGYGIVHGDYRIGNMMLVNGKMVALLDWELCTLGDPLADVGYLLNNWTQPGEDWAENPTIVGGFGDRDELCEIYSARTGRDLSGINYYRAFSHWRLAAITQGVYKRYLVGAMGDQELDMELYRANINKRAVSALELLTT